MSECGEINELSALSNSEGSIRVILYATIVSISSIGVSVHGYKFSYTFQKKDI